MSTDAYIVLSVLLAVVVIAVLAVALILVRRGLTAISGPRTLGEASGARRDLGRSSRRSRRSTRSSSDPLGPAEIGRKAAVVAERRPR